MIPPALTPSQWADVQKYGVDYLRAEMGPATLWNGDDGPAAILAVANAALPDDDPRKITWATVDGLREAADEVDCSATLIAGGWADTWLRALADALASYLPPPEATP